MLIKSPGRGGSRYKIHYTPMEQAELMVVPSQLWTAHFAAALSYLMSRGFEAERCVRFIMKGAHRHAAGPRSAHRLCWALQRRAAR